MKYLMFCCMFWLSTLATVDAQRGCLAGDCANDYGVYVWDNGDRYAGEFGNHQLNGYGVYTFGEGSAYAGMFTNGQRDGFGRLEWSSGDVYLGTWENGQRSGFGKMIFKNGTVQEGEWQSDQMINNSSLGEGCVDGDCINGEGVFAWKSGDLYYGSFQNGRLDGEGVYLYKNGSIYAGSFQNGSCQGEGVYYATNGGRYMGGFKNCYFHGQGVYNFPDGNVQEGRWDNGKFLEETAHYTAEEYFNLAYKADNDQEKIRLYTKAIEQKPNFSMAYNNRAWSYMSIGQNQVALQDCNKALQYNSQNKHAFHTRGIVKYNLGKYESAVADYDRALKIDPEYSVAIRDRKKAVSKLNQHRPQDKTPPVIAITSPQVRGTKVVTKGEKIQVRGKISDASGVQSLLINGYDVRLSNPGGKVSSFSVELTLSQGQNQFWAIAGDVYGNKSPKKSFFIERQSEVKTVPNSGNNGARTALVIGNADYLVGPLGDQPRNDARDMAKALREVGFEVLLFTDLQTRGEMKDAVRQYSNKIKARGGTGLVYYAGHGMQVNGENYLMPTKATPQAEIDVEDEGLRMSWLLGQAETNNNSMNILILDACRNNPFERSWRSGSGSGLAGVNSAPMGTFIAFATSPNSVASNGSGRNGLYTQELLKAMRKPGLTIEQVFKQVRYQVSQESNEMQVPWENSSIIGDFYFKK